MIPRILVVVLLGSVTALAAPVPKELKKKPDAERILGVWAYDSSDLNGAKGAGGRWYFNGDKLYSGGSNTTDARGSEYGVSLRSDQSPTHLDISMNNAPLCVGIYKFVGDDLHLAYVSSSSKAERPKNFDSADGKTVMSFKRVPEPKK